MKLGPLKAKFHPAARQLQGVLVAPEDEFTKRYRMYSSDPGSAPRMLAQAFRDHLAPLDYKNLHIRGANAWIFVLRIGSRVAPAQYPELLDAAVQLVSKLDLPDRCDSPRPLQEPGGARGEATMQPRAEQ